MKRRYAVATIRGGSAEIIKDGLSKLAADAFAEGFNESPNSDAVAVVGWIIEVTKRVTLKDQKRMFIACEPLSKALQKQVQRVQPKRNKKSNQ